MHATIAATSIDRYPVFVAFALGSSFLWMYLKMISEKDGSGISNADRDYFDRIASRWDEVRRGFFGESVREKALNLAGVQKGEVAADVGAGSGFITEGLLARGLKVIAVDQSEAMLDIIRKKVTSTGWLDCRQGTEKALPIDSRTVDYVFANMYLHHVESPERAIAEMVRILKSGGKLIVTDLDEHPYEILAKEQHDRWLGFKREDVKRWFEAADLKEVSVDCLNERCTSESDDGTVEADVSIFIAVGVRG